MKIESVSESMTIVFDEASLQRSETGQVTSVIFFDFGSFQFPFAGWQDSAIPIVGFWMGACEKLITGAQGDGRFSFMEGTFEVDVHAISDVAVDLTCIERNGSNRKQLFSTTVRFEHLLKELERVATSLEKACVRHGWADISGYREFALKLKRVFADAGYRLLPFQA